MNNLKSSEMTNTSLLDSELSMGSSTTRRRQLLPLWIKIFIWIFMVIGFVAPLGIVFGILGMDFHLSLYGLETTKPLAMTGLSIILLLAVKGVVSLGLWTEKDWAINLAIIDAIIGIIICIVIVVMPVFIENDGFNISLRLELIALIPYLIKMKKIKGDWEKRN